MLAFIYFLKIFIFSLLHISPFILAQPTGNSGCRPIYVRWPRVRLNNQQGGAKSSAAGPNLSFGDCQKACSEDKNPATLIGGNNSGTNLQCSALNHRSGFGSVNECQIFSREHVQHTDGYMEADDRYTFYWKFCVDTQRSCTGEYAFTFLSDRYMMKSEVSRTKFTKTLEDCLAECLNDSKILCRSVSFNRTDGGCHLSEQNQLSKPAFIRINNNPNYRIDYYENNCYNNSFKFTSICEPNGIRIRVDSRIPYTGALYGLYDFFSCRIEPKEANSFDFLFPYPNLARNCSDSMRQSGDEIVLEVILSTDGVEPLYFITADDLTYQARCPLQKFTGSPHPREHYELTGQIGDSKRGASINSILEALSSAAEPTNVQRRFGTTILEDETEGTTPTTSAKSSTKATSTTENSRWWSWTTLKPFTKDVFTLPLYSLGGFGAEKTEEDSQKSTTASIIPTNSLENPECLKKNGNCERTSDGGKGHSPRINDSLASESIRDDSTSTKSSITSATSTPTSTIHSSLTEKTTLNKEAESKATPKLKPTTILVHQQQSSNIAENEASDDDSDGTTSNGRQRNSGNGKSGQRLGMEPIFEDDEDSTTATASTLTTVLTTVLNNSSSTAPTTTLSQTTSSLENETTKTTTKRSTDSQTNWDDGRKKFTFSTHLAFPNDGILVRTGGSDSSTSTAGNDGGHSSTQSSTGTSNGSGEQNTISSSTTASPTTASTTLTSESPSSSNFVNEGSQSAAGPSTSSPEPPPKSSSTSSVGTTNDGQQQGARSEFNPLAVFGSFGSRPGTSHSAQREKIIFDIYHNGQPAEAVVVGSRITLAFTPYFAIPPTHMSISGCQVEPIGSLYEWEKEPLAIIKDGCQADHVGLVCPPQKTDYGIRVTVEAFRYQTTTQVQYTCLLRVCPFAPCPPVQCAAVEGCSGDDIVSRTFGLSRAKRDHEGIMDGGLAQRPHHPFQGGLRGVWAALQQDERQQNGGELNEWNEPQNQQQVIHRMSTAVQQQLIQLGGDSLVRRRLIVVNSEDELRFYAKTGELPQIRPGT